MDHNWIRIQEEHMQGKSTQQASQYSHSFLLLVLQVQRRTLPELLGTYWYCGCCFPNAQLQSWESWTSTDWNKIKTVSVSFLSLQWLFEPFTVAHGALLTSVCLRTEICSIFSAFFSLKTPNHTAFSPIILLNYFSVWSKGKTHFISVHNKVLLNFSGYRISL